MIELLEKADPAAGAQIDKRRIRELVDERVGVTVTVTPRRTQPVRPWLVAAVSVSVVAIAASLLLKPDETSIFQPDYDGILNHPGIEDVVPIGAGVSTMGVDGDTLWVMSALFNELKKIDNTTGDIEATYQIDAYVEGVVPGGGYVWLHSYDNDGETLRFNPGTGSVDMAIPIPGSPWHRSVWYGDRLWVSNDQGETFTISADGDLVAEGPGSLEGEGLGYLWLSDGTGSLVSISEDGTRGEVVIPWDPDTAMIDEEGNVVDLTDPFELTEAGGYLWLITGDDPATRTTLVRIDPSDGETLPLVIGPGLHGMTEHDGYLWVISLTDHLLIRVDPETREISRFPMPGKTGGIVVADGALWVDLFHPGAVVRVDTDAALTETAPVVAEMRTNGHRLLCTAGSDPTGPTIILEAPQWIGSGWWSVVQASLSNAGYTVCANGYLSSNGAPQAPEQRAADLTAALDDLTGPYLLVTGGDGVHTSRLFAHGRDDIAGVVMVDPVPIGWDEFLASVVVAVGEDPNGIPDGAEMDPGVSAGLDDFGSSALVVIGQDPEAVFLNDNFVETYGEGAQDANRFWQDGLAFYAGLSSNSRQVVATGTGLHMVVWDRPDIVVNETLDMLESIQP